MSYYRIRIDELYNGEIRYMPQAGSLITHRGWLSTRSEVQWNDMVLEGFAAESEALAVIELIRSARAEKKAKQIMSSTYKNID